MSPEDVTGMFLYGCSELHATPDIGLQPDNDQETLDTLGALSLLVYRCVVAGDSPWELAVSRLCTLTAALVVSPQLGNGPEIAAKWQAAKAEVFELWRLAAS